MTANYRNAAGVDFDSLFAPYVQGSPPAATGYRDSSGTDLAGRYAPISFGSKGPDVGYRTAAGLDVSNLWAAIGTAVYALAINGTTYAANAQSGTLASSSSLTFSSTSSGWAVSRGVSPNTGSGTLASGANPTGATGVSFALTLTTTSGTFHSSNSAPTNSAIGSSWSASVSASATPASPEGESFGTLVITYYNSGGAAISTTTIYLQATAVGGS